MNYEDGQEAKVYQPRHSVGVDLGEIHTMAAFFENGQALLIIRRKVRSLHRLRNKKLAKTQRHQSKCQKGSIRASETVRFIEIRAAAAGCAS
jgi:putative transposase